MILLDTNVLGRIPDPADPQRVAARRAMDVLAAQGQRLVIVPQNLYEFRAVATRKPGRPPTGQNGLGMTPDQASLWLRYFQRRFKLLPDQEDLFPRWHDLVRSFGVTGLRSHDARLVASMQCHGITQLLTFNADDFKRFPIALIDPASL